MATIVLLPGMDGSGTLFSEFIASLPAGLKPLVVPYPPDEAMGYRELEALVLEKLPSRPFILVGESFSGPIAVAVAARAPAGLRGLVLVCSFVRRPIPAPSVLRWLLALLPVRWIPMRLAAAVLLGQHASPAHRMRLSAAMAGVAPAAWRARLRAVLSVDMSERLRSVRVPVLYLQGKHDRLIPSSAWELIKKSVSSARCVELEGPHFLLQAKPVESATHVGAFAKEVGFAL